MAMALAQSASERMALIVHPQFMDMLNSPPNKLSFWEEKCCDHVLRKIASSLDAASLASLGLANRRCSRIAACDELWRQLCVAKFNCPPTAELNDAITWKDVYRFNVEAFQYLLAQSTAEALMKFGIQSSSSNFTLNMTAMA